MIDRLFGRVKEEDIDQLLKMGEGEQVEFKSRVTTILHVAQIASAFGNGKGGVILIGVREHPLTVVGCDIKRLSEAFSKVENRVRPVPEMVLHDVPYKGKTVGVIVVKPYKGDVVISDAGAYIRKGETTRALTAEEILDRVPKKGERAVLRELADALAENTNTIQELLESSKSHEEETKKLQDKIDRAQSWRGQWIGWLVGFILGFVAGVGANYAFKALGN